MKTTSQLAERISLPREFGILDTLVLMLAATLLGAWILGTLYLSFFPAKASANASSQTAALLDGENESSGDPALNDAGDPNQSQATGGDFNSSQFSAASDLTNEDKTVMEQKISKLQEQLETKSQELTQLRKTSKKSADTKSKAAADTSKYKSEITQLTKQKGRLDQEIKKLNDLSNTQKAKIQTLQDQLAAVANTNPIAAEANARDVEDNIPALDGASPQNQPLEFRDWISSKGNKARLAFVRWEGDEIVVVNEADKEFRLTLNRISPQDQDYVNSKR